MVDAQRANIVGKLGHRVQGHQLPARRVHVKQRQQGRVKLVLIFGLRDHTVSVIGRVDRRHLALAVSRIQRVFDLAGSDSERRCLVAIDIHVDLRVLNEQVAGNVLQQTPELGIIAQLGFQSRRVIVQGELVLALGQVAADANGRQHLRICTDSRYLRERGPQFLHQLHRRVAGLARG